MHFLLFCQLVQLLLSSLSLSLLLQFQLPVLLLVFPNCLKINFSLLHPLLHCCYSALQLRFVYLFLLFICLLEQFFFSLHLNHLLLLLFKLFLPFLTESERKSPVSRADKVRERCSCFFPSFAASGTDAHSCFLALFPLYKLL